MQSFTIVISCSEENCLIQGFSQRSVMERALEWNILLKVALDSIRYVKLNLAILIDWKDLQKLLTSQPKAKSGPRWFQVNSH